jgi:hypothetical protein
MIHAHQPGSQPIDIPEVIPNPAVVPTQEPAPKEPAPKNPVKEPEKVPAGYPLSGIGGWLARLWASQAGVMLARYDTAEVAGMERCYTSAFVPPAQLAPDCTPSRTADSMRLHA